MRITFTDHRHLTDAEEDESVLFAPGTYPFEERPNPVSGTGPPWYCLQGTYIGMSAQEFVEWTRPVQGKRLVIIER